MDVSKMAFFDKYCLYFSNYCDQIVLAVSLKKSAFLY